MPTSSGYDYLGSAYEDDTPGIDFNELDDLRAQYLAEQLQNEIKSIRGNTWMGQTQKDDLVRQRQDAYTQSRSQLDYGKRNRDAVKRVKEAATRVKERERDLALGNVYGDNFYNRPTPDRARLRYEREKGFAESKAQEARNRTETEAFTRRVAADPMARFDLSGRPPTRSPIVQDEEERRAEMAAVAKAPGNPSVNTDYFGLARYTGARGVGQSSQEMFDSQKRRDRLAPQLWEGGVNEDAYDRAARLYRSGVSPNAVFGETQRRHEDEQKRRRVQRLQGQNSSTWSAIDRQGVVRSGRTERPLSEVEIEYA